MLDRSADRRISKKPTTQAVGLHFVPDQFLATYSGRGPEAMSAKGPAGTPSRAGLFVCRRVPQTRIPVQAAIAKRMIVLGLAVGPL